jgi:hypothetical protein
MHCRWWNRHGNAKALKKDTGSCMLAYHFGKHVPVSHASFRQPHDRCDFFGRSGELPRDYVQELQAYTAAQALLERLALLR